MCSHETNVLKQLFDEDAFTLIEVLVVCLLISIILTVGIPVLNGTLFTDQLKTASRKIIGTVRDAREHAVSNQKSLVLVFDLERDRLWYENDDPKTTQGKRPAVHAVYLPPSVRIVDIWTKSQGKQSHGTVNLWIKKQGYMDRTIIHITNTDDILSIILSPFLGSIKVVGGYAESD